MGLFIKIDYLPLFEEIKKERDLLDLLSDVQRELNSFSRLKSSKLSHILEFIEKEVFDGNLMVGRGNVRYLVDLSKAKGLIEEYKWKSEKGCQSCVERAEIHKDNVIYSYCRLTENEKDVDAEKGHSPKIERYSEKSCKNKIPFFRSIKEILERVD